MVRIAVLYDLYLSEFYARYLAKPKEWGARSLWWKFSYAGYRVTIAWNVLTMIGSIQSLAFEDRAHLVTRIDQISLVLTAVVTAACMFAIERDVRTRERARQKKDCV